MNAMKRGDGGEFSSHWVFRSDDGSVASAPVERLTPPAPDTAKLRRDKAMRVARFMTLREECLTGASADPVFNILIELFMADCQVAPVNITSACHAARVPHTTALRVLQTMEQRDGTIVRYADRKDKRRHYVMLSPKGRHQVEAYLDRLIEMQNADPVF